MDIQQKTGKNKLMKIKMMMMMMMMIIIIIIITGMSIDQYQ